MSEEAEANLADGEEIAPETEAEEVETETPDEPQLDEDGNPVEEPDEELEDVERDGKTYKIPKALKAELMMEADYRKKTMELADQRRAVEAERLAAVQINQQHVAAYAKAQQQHDLVTAYEQWTRDDWANLREQDQGLYDEHKFTYDQAKEARQQAFGELQQVRQQTEQEQQRITAKRTQDCVAELSRDIPGFGPELLDKIDAHGRATGFTAQELASVTDPRLIKVLHQASLYAESQKTQKVTQKLTASQTAAPTPRIGAKAPAGKSPERMSADEWMKHRNAQLQKAGLR